VRAIDRTSSLPKERFSISVIFLVHGLVVASWVSRIPAIQAALGLSPGVLGTVLLSATACSLVAMPVTGGLIHRFGSRPLVILTTILFCLGLSLVPRPDSAAGLAASLFVFGAAAGGMDVAMNVQAAEFERKRGKPVMSSFHGLFSVGGMLGSALGGASAERGLGPGVHFALASLTFGVLATSVLPWLSPGSSRSESSLTFRFDRKIAILGAIGFCILLGEGAMADWSAVYLHGSLGSGPGLAALGYSVFSACMAGGRLLGDRLTLALGPVRLVRTGALVAASGMTVAILVENVAVALAGFALVGAGFSTIIPIIFGTGASVKGVPAGTGVAAVTTAGYLGFLLGPPLIGWSAQLTSLRTALGFVAVLSLVAALLARWVKRD
jgi:MFS family permease